MALFGRLLAERGRPSLDASQPEFAVPAVAALDDPVAVNAFPLAPGCLVGQRKGLAGGLGRQLNAANGAVALVEADKNLVISVSLRHDPGLDLCLAPGIAVGPLVETLDLRFRGRGRAGYRGDAAGGGDANDDAHDHQEFVADFTHCIPPEKKKQVLIAPPPHTLPAAMCSYVNHVENESLASRRFPRKAQAELDKRRPAGQFLSSLPDPFVRRMRRPL